MAETNGAGFGLSSNRTVLVTVHHPMSRETSEMRVLIQCPMASAWPSHERTFSSTQIHLIPIPTSRKRLIMNNTGGRACRVRERKLASGMAEILTAFQDD